MIGDICDCKSLIVEAISMLVAESRNVYWVERPYDTIASEARDLAEFSPNSLLVIENFLDLRMETLTSVVEVCRLSQMSLLLTSRQISARAEVQNFAAISQIATSRFDIPRLRPEEIDQLLTLTDQIGAWRDRSLPTRQRFNYVQRDCAASLPTFLLELTKSPFVKERYSLELHKTHDLLSKQEFKVVVAALCLANIGHRAPVELLSNAFQIDAEASLRRIERAGTGLKLARLARGQIQTIPSVGAHNLLREIVPQVNNHIVVDVTLTIVNYLISHTQIDDYTNTILNQTMRYSVLRRICSNENEITRFFDHLSKSSYCRTRVLFWLQWHIALSDQKKWVKADEMLQAGYNQAQIRNFNAGRDYDTFQLDDRKAKFLMLRAKDISFTPTVLHDFKESALITSRLLNRSDVSHHPYETIRIIAETAASFAFNFTNPQWDVVRGSLKNLENLGKRRKAMLSDDYSKGKADYALEKLSQVLTERAKGSP